MLCRRDFNILRKLQIWSTASEEKVNPGNFVKISTFSAGGEMIVRQSFDSSSNDEVLSHKSGHGLPFGVREISWNNTAQKYS